MSKMSSTCFNNCSQKFGGLYIEVVAPS